MARDPRVDPWRGDIVWKDGVKRAVLWVRDGDVSYSGTWAQGRRRDGRTVWSGRDGKTSLTRWRSLVRGASVHYVAGTCENGRPAGLVGGGCGQCQPCIDSTGRAFAAVPA